jgi:hypothetical protein
MFERFYKQHLSKRLLLGRVANEGVEQVRLHACCVLPASLT